jgi:hypothetical protein
MGERVRRSASGRYKGPMSNAAAKPQARSAWPVYVAIVTAVGVFLGAVGPFGSYFNGPTHVRIGYWVVTAWIGMLTLGLAYQAAGAAARRTGAPVWFVLAGAMLLVTAPLAFVISMIARSVWPNIPPMTWFDWYAQVLAITIFQFGVYRLTSAALNRQAGVASPPPTAEVATTDSGVLCLRMEDHYVRIHTASGSRLVHGTLSQAMAALAGVEGLQVHRSWWVARAAVRRPVWDGRNLRLELTNGLSVPVSRSAVAKLRTAGWLNAD